MFLTIGVYVDVDIHVCSSERIMIILIIVIVTN